MPAAPEGIVPMRELPGVLAPGIALMLLPHVGRHLMRTRDKARILDVQYLLLSLPGAALALLPLVPNFAWTSYYLALWPLATVVFVPTSLGAWISGLPGARRFLLACLVSMSGATLGILGMYAFLSSPLLPAGPLLGVTLGALFIAGTALPKDDEPESERAEAKTQDEPEEEEESGLRLLSPEEIPEDSPYADPALHPEPSAPLLSARDAESAFASGAALEHSPPHTVFDLQQLLREAHTQAAEEAERKGLRISWFMPPHLPQYYSGNARGISQVIRLLLESSVRASGQGFVQLTVRRVPESVNPGHLLFSISDSGSGMPPHARSALALAKAWELAGEQGGGMSAESDARGATINFTLQLEPQSAPQAEEDIAAQARRVIIVDEFSGNRQLLAFFLEGLPCVAAEARNIGEAAQICRTERAALLLINCEMPEAGHLDALKNFLTGEREQGLSATPVLAIEPEGAAWKGLHDLENVHRLAKPVSRSGLREKVLELLQRRAVPLALETDFSRPGEGAPDAEAPLDLPQPVEYGPDFAPPGERFDPLSLDHGLSLPPPAASLAAAAPESGPRAHPSLTAPRANAQPAATPPMRLSMHAPERQTSFAGYPPGAGYGANPPYARQAADEWRTGEWGTGEWVGEWVGEPTPMQPQMSQPAQPPRAWEATRPAYAAPYPPAPYHDAVEWVGEPVPIPRAQEHASLLRPFARHAAQPVRMEEEMEEMPSSSFSGPQQGELLAWVDGARVAQSVPPPHSPAQYPGWGVAQPVRRAPEQPAPPAYGAPSPYGYQGAPRLPQPQHAVQPPAPTRDDYVPLRLTDPSQASPAPGRTLAPETSAPLFPEDHSLLGFVLGDKGQGARKAAAPPRPTRLARAAQGLVNFVRNRADAPAQFPSFREQPEHAARQTQPAAGERPAGGLSGSAVEQMQPLIPGLLASLDEAMDDVRRGFHHADPVAVEEAAARIAARADNYGLRVLARMARCVEMAARAQDKDALVNILPDLETAVERNRIALQPKK
jgi:CheY-like chemotaxis protein